MSFLHQFLRDLFAPVFETLTLASALSMLLTACEERYCWRGVGVWANLALIQLWNGKSQEASRLLIFLTSYVCCKKSERSEKPCASRLSQRKWEELLKPALVLLLLRVCPLDFHRDLVPALSHLTAGLLFIISSASFGGCYCSWHITVHAKYLSLT